MNMSRWRVCELWIATCVVAASAAALAGAPSVSAATAFVALSCIPVATVMLWPSGRLTGMPAKGSASR